MRLTAPPPPPPPLSLRFLPDNTFAFRLFLFSTSLRSLSAVIFYFFCSLCSLITRPRRICLVVSKQGPKRSISSCRPWIFPARFGSCGSTSSRAPPSTLSFDPSGRYFALESIVRFLFLRLPFFATDLSPETDAMNDTTPSPTPGPATKASKSPPTSAAGTKRKRTPTGKYYAVKVGYQPGVYNAWNECLTQVTGYKGAVCESFETMRSLLRNRGRRN